MHGTSINFLGGGVQQGIMIFGDMLGTTLFPFFFFFFFLLLLFFKKENSEQKNPQNETHPQTPPPRPSPHPVQLAACWWRSWLHYIHEMPEASWPSSGDRPGCVRFLRYSRLPGSFNRSVTVGSLTWDGRCLSFYFTQREGENTVLLPSSLDLC